METRTSPSSIDVLPGVDGRMLCEPSRRGERVSFSDKLEKSASASRALPRGAFCPGTNTLRLEDQLTDSTFQQARLHARVGLYQKDSLAASTGLTFLASYHLSWMARSQAMQEWLGKPLFTLTE